MTVTAVPIDRTRPTRPRRWAATADIALMTQRNLILWLRVPAYVVATLVQPIILVLLFRYVFGGEIRIVEKGGYVNYLMPGIVGQTVAFASVGTAVALALELKKGVIDRFRSTPMARAAVLGGRLAADAVRILATVAVIVGVGYAVGFRFENGLLAAAAMMLLAAAFGVSLCCVTACVGIAVQDAESVQAIALVLLLPLSFVSSAVVRVSSMPSWLQGVARNQPVSVVVDAMRSLALGGPVASHVLPALWWTAGIAAVFATLAIRAYRQAGGP